MITAPTEGRALPLLTPRWIAIGGIALGVFAFWLSIPPISTRAPWWPVLIGLCAIAAGVWAISRGQRRAGWGAVAAGLIGIALGLLATRASTGHLDQVVVWSALLTGMLVWATPLTFAAIGGMFCERSGVVNIGLEGMMLSGAFFGVLGADKFGSWGWGLVTAMIAGGGFALVHAFFAIQLRADQIVGGTAINFLALGVTGYFFIKIYGANGTPGNLSRIPDLDRHTAVVGPIFRGIDGIPFVGDVLGQLNLMIWLSFLILVVAHIVLFKTPIGLRLRSVGEHPRAADTVGVSVYGVRYAATVLSGMLAALGGAYLAIGYVGSFSENMTAGRGFIALAALIFGKWKPWGLLAACLLFGFSQALGDALQTIEHVNAFLVFNLPYIFTLIALVGVIGRSRGPAAAGLPYARQ